MKAVLPPGAAVLPVGGITPGRMAEYLQSGAAGFGLGSALYKPGMEVAEVTRNAMAFVAESNRSHRLWRGPASPPSRGTAARRASDGAFTQDESFTPPRRTPSS